MPLGTNVSLWVCLGCRCAVVVLMSLLGISSSASAAEKDLGNVMCLGDSITNGYPYTYSNTQGGYRDQLVRNLIGAGYTFKMVGSRTNGSAYLASVGQSAAEGHDGYYIDGAANNSIAPNLPAWIGPGKAAPDIILLMIGTNDMASGNPVGAPDRLSNLIGQISNRTTGLRPNATLIVAGITLNTNKTQDTNTVAYNAGVSEVVRQHQLLGEKVSYIDMHPVLTPADMSDWVHPNQTGYNKLGDAWFGAVSATVPEPVSLAPAILVIGCLLRRRRVG